MLHPRDSPNSHSLVSCVPNSKSDFNLIWIGIKEFEFLDLVGFRGVAFSVKSVIVQWWVDFMNVSAFQDQLSCESWLNLVEFLVNSVARVEVWNVTAFLPFFGVENPDQVTCVAVCCSVVQCGAVCCSVLQCVAMCCRALQSVVVRVVCCVCCSVLQCAAVCCSVLRCVAVCVAECLPFWSVFPCCSVLQCVAVCCSVLQCVAVCCSVLQCCRRSTFLKCVSMLQCVAVYCSLMQKVFLFEARFHVVVCQIVLQRLAVCCSMLQKVYLFEARSSPATKKKSLKSQRYGLVFFHVFIFPLLSIFPLYIYIYIYIHTYIYIYINI